MQPDQSQPRKEELNPKNTSETPTPISTPLTPNEAQSQTPSSGVDTPRKPGFNSPEAKVRAIQWASSLTPTMLDYIDDQGY